MTLLLTPARIAEVNMPIIGPDGQAGNDGSPSGAPSHAPMSGTTSADVVDSLVALQANDTGSTLVVTPTVAGGTGGRGGNGTDGTAQNGGNDGWGGWVTLSLPNLGVGTIATPFQSSIYVFMNATGGFAGGDGIAGQRGPVGSVGRIEKDSSTAITNGGDGGNGGNGGGAAAVLDGMTAIMAHSPVSQNQPDDYADYVLTASGKDGTAGGDGARGSDSGLFGLYQGLAVSGSGGHGGTGGRGLAIVNGAALSYQGSVGAGLGFTVKATGGNGANGGVGGDASLLVTEYGVTGLYGPAGNGGAGGTGGRAAAVFSQNSIQSANGLSVDVNLVASAGAGGKGGAGGSGGSSSDPHLTAPLTPGVPGLAGQDGANGQAVIAINANHLQLGRGSYLGLDIEAYVGGVGQPLNTPGGAVFQFNGNSFQAAGDSELNLSRVFGGSAVIDVGAGTLTIASSSVNRIGGFSSLRATGQGGDLLIDAPGSQQYDLRDSRKFDTVMFRPGHGADSVTPYQLEPHYRIPSFGTIELDGFGATLGTFSQVLAAAVDTGADTRIATPDGGSILVVGYHAIDLTAADFHFG